MRLCIAICATVALHAQDPFLQWMDRIAQQQLDERAARLAAIQSPEQVHQRQRQIKAKLLEIIGGLPSYQGPLRARVLALGHSRLDAPFDATRQRQNRQRENRRGNHRPDFK